MLCRFVVYILWCGARLRGCPALLYTLGILYVWICPQINHRKLCRQSGCCDEQQGAPALGKPRSFAALVSHVHMPAASPGSCAVPGPVVGSPTSSSVPASIACSPSLYPPAMYKGSLHQCQFTEQVPIRSHLALQAPSCRNKAFSTLGMIGL